MGRSRAWSRERRLGVALVLSGLLIFGFLGVVGYLFQLPLTLSFIAKTPYGEELKASITVTARPSFLSYLSRQWSLAWRVGTTQRENVNIKVQIQVTGTNIASDATVYFYVEARDASDASKTYKEIDYSSNGTQISVGSAATFQTDDMTIDTHLSHIYGSAPTSDKTVDYYVWCRVEATGLISGQTLTVEIPVTKFDTVTYDYGVETTTTDTFSITVGDNDGYVYGRGLYSTARETAYKAETDGCLQVGQSYSSTANYYYVYRVFLKFDTTSIPESATITSATLKLYGYANRMWDGTFDICVQKWTGDTPIDTGDYNQFDGVTYGTFGGGSFHTDAWNEITISEPGDLIEKGGYTKICLRSSKDINGIAPNNYDLVQFYDAVLNEGAYPPTLEVTYTCVDWSASWSWVNASTLSIMALQIVRDLLTVVALFMSIIVSWLTIRLYRRRLKK